MNDLIKIDINENQEPIVSGRELHEILGIDTQYTKWFERMCEYGFNNNIDYCITYQNKDGNVVKNDYVEKLTNNQMSRMGISINHAIKLDMAKEIAMIQRNERGKKVRQYFIQVEKDFNSPEKIMARALKLADKQIGLLQIENEKQNQIIGELKPKADYTDKILQSKGTVKVNVIANDYGLSAQALNGILHKLGIQYKQGKDWLLYRKYRGMGYTHSKTIHFYHKDGTPDTNINMEWTQKGRLFLYELLKKNGVIPSIERN